MLSVMQNNEIWDIMKLVFQKEGFTNVYDRYELDYQFFNNNIKGIDSQEDREQLARKLGIKYILKPAVLDVRESDGFVYDALNTNAEYSFPREVYPIPNKPAGNQANLKYELIETSSGEVVYRVDFTNSYSANIDEDGINHDYGTVMRTLRSGTKKGTRFTIADCSCPKKKYIKRRKFWEKLGY